MIMRKILVSGLINIETSVKVKNFPIEYCPIDYPFFGVASCVSGVGFNVAKALKALGDKPDLLTEIGDDLNGEMVLAQLKKEKIERGHVVVFKGKQTAESVVLVDDSGKRRIYCDLKDIQDREPLEESAVNLEDYSLVALTNINFNRRLLKAAKEKGVAIATDVHVLSDVEDSYNKDFMENASLLFLSNESIKGREGDWMMDLFRRYRNPIIVCGCGDAGALLYLGRQNRFIYEPAVAPKGVVSTLGAGDALFSAFIHFYNKGEDPEVCLKKAVCFAGYKISEPGGSNGFVGEECL